MRSILEANYSRKLAALKYREVQIPDDNELKSKQGLLHWHWAFECPPVIKLMVRSHLDDSKPQVRGGLFFLFVFLWHKPPPCCSRF